MEDAARWSIAEIMVRYDLEPELQDIFVEGVIDKEIYINHLDGNQTPHKFYEVDVVDIPLDLLERYGLTSGNKQRIMALALELEKLSAEAQVFCIADRDLDHWFEDIKNTKRLQWSSYCAIESHFLTHDVLKKILVATCRTKIEYSTAFFDSFVKALRQLYALRLADRQFGWKLSWIPAKRYLSSDQKLVRFDIVSYIDALLQKNCRVKDKDEFVKSAVSWLEKVDGDPRLSARGHDYTDLLAWAAHEFKGNKAFAVADVMERLFVLLASMVPTLATDIRITT